MRVLMLVSDAHGGRGGIAQYNRDVIAALSANDQISEIVVLPRLAEPSDYSLPPKVRYDWSATGGQIAFIRRTLAAAAAAGRFDLVFCGHINLMPVAALAKWVMRGKLVLAVHGTEVWEPSASLAARLALGAADSIFSVSQFTLDKMARWHGAAKHMGKVIPNTFRPEGYGMAPPSADLAARLGLTGKRVIMTLGRMASDERAKGFDEVIELMPALLARCPLLAYLCAGDGDDRARLEEKVTRLGLSHAVIFAGAVPEQEKPDYYRLADAFILASRGEGFGIVLLEAMACGIPVVGSTADATQEALLHGELGPSVDPKDCAALADAILAAIERPKTVPTKLNKFGFERFCAQISAGISALV